MFLHQNLSSSECERESVCVFERERVRMVSGVCGEREGGGGGREGE